ncbi:hypothetical protein [Variovorax ginsengisoli]|uniref:OmpR/PhoB-type domain-containing protein n=1 Tax=Variovorax ginsengisoli TaxID=363844 RepID=A0ABT8SF77_9BURK|nr:hypothetical protein [Variovorax ginsengisoli]MDN8618235.1 hypothetical protein [Variovorax ginsengisoli]MDO1537405.1 hypothetical protein [Variovorax ginsengisoli]
MVTEDSVVQCVGELRAALGARGPVLVKTIPRRGYLLDVVVSSSALASRPDSSDAAAASVANARSPGGGVQKRLVLALLIALSGWSGSYVVAATGPPEH